MRKSAFVREHWRRRHGTADFGGVVSGHYRENVFGNYSRDAQWQIDYRNAYDRCMIETPDSGLRDSQAEDAKKCEKQAKEHADSQKREGHYNGKGELSEYMEEAERLHPGFKQFLEEQKINVKTPREADVIDKAAFALTKYRDKLKGDVPVGAYYPEIRPFTFKHPTIIVEPEQSDPEMTLLHEYAHAKRAQTLKEKGMPDFPQSGEGEAEHFEERMRKVRGFFKKDMLSEEVLRNASMKESREHGIPIQQTESYQKLIELMRQRLHPAPRPRYKK